MNKILFLHGFFATGSCPMATALTYIQMLIDKEKPDMFIGNSCGAFLAQILSPVAGIPALLGNPHFKNNRCKKR